MALKHFKPTTPGQRQLVLIDRSDLHKGKPVKTLVESLSTSGGRNNMGRVTSFQRGGGHKRAYRMIDFKRKNMTWWLWLSVWNTIQIVPPLLR